MEFSEQGEPRRPPNRLLDATELMLRQNQAKTSSALATSR
jgi:hypothetical protein